MLVRKLCQVLCGGLCWLLRTCPFYCSVLNLCQLCCSMYFGSMMMCWTYVSSIALCAMVSVLLWWKMRKQWRFFVNILWWKLPCSVTKINIPYGLPRGAKLCRHMARICDDTWHDSNDPRGRHNEHVAPPWKLTWHWPRGSGHVTCQCVTQSQVSRRRGPRHVA